MVVQCPTCQSKFRIADDKVTDRGVRVRCTSCKNVFQVKKPGSSSSEPPPGPGSTMDLSSLNAAAVARPGARPAASAARAGAAASRPPPAVAKPAASRPPPAASRPPPAASRPPAAARGGSNGAARRLDADDLFGMAELTGDAPLGDMAKALANAPPPSNPPPAAKPAVKAAKPMPNFDDIDIEVDDTPGPPPPPSRPPPPKTRPPPPPRAAEPPPPPADASGDEATAVDAPKPPPSPPADGQEAGEDGPAKIGGFKLKDPFEGMNLGEPGTGAIDLATQPKKDKLAEALKTEPPPSPPVPDIPPGREMVSSALTGLVGAALAIAVVVVAALNGDAASAGWIGFGAHDDVVATRVVSGLYDTASGKPVFYVRGRIENRGKKVRGPVRVTAELVSDGAAEAYAEAIAGAEPTPEEVWSLRTSTDVEKLNHVLETSNAERKLQPGTSLPFFAVIADPPMDLQRHRLHVKVESVDAWVPPSPGKKAR